MRRIVVTVWLPFALGMGLFSWLVFAGAGAAGEAKAGPAATSSLLLPLISRDFSFRLERLNQYRQQAGLPVLLENPDWSLGAGQHAQYMVKTDQLVASQDRVAFPQWYTDEGNYAASRSLLLVTDTVALSNQALTDFWMRSPFQALSVLDPELRAGGLGFYREADGGVQAAAVLNVLSGWQAGAPASVAFPVRWPGAGARAPVRAYSGVDNPDPRLAPGCAGAQGLPILLQLGDGSLANERLADEAPTYLTDGQGPLAHCAFSATEYPANLTDGNYGKLLLDTRDAVVLMPLAPLTAGLTYTVSITAVVNAQPSVVSWSFAVAPDAGP